MNVHAHLGSAMRNGVGQISGNLKHLKLSLNPTEKLEYSNAQWDDYRYLKRKDFQNHAELTFQCEAKWTGPDDMVGTSGFGFWNDPFMMTGWRWPALPQAFWFMFESKRSKLSFESSEDHQTGLSAMVVNAKSLSAILWMMFCALTFPMLVLAPWRRWLRRVWPQALQQFKVPLNINTKTWQQYKIKWETNSIKFWVNDTLVLDQAVSVTEPQGLVIWMDNQYAVVEPWGVWSFGSEPINGEQALELKSVCWGPSEP